MSFTFKEFFMISALILKKNMSLHFFTATHSAQDKWSKSLIELIVIYRLYRAHLEKEYRNFQHGGTIIVVISLWYKNVVFIAFFLNLTRAQWAIGALSKIKWKSCVTMLVDVNLCKNRSRYQREKSFTYFLKLILF